MNAAQRLDNKASESLRLTPRERMIVLVPGAAIGAIIAFLVFFLLQGFNVKPFKSVVYVPLPCPIASPDNSPQPIGTPEVQPSIAPEQTPIATSEQAQSAGQPLPSQTMPLPVNPQPVLGEVRRAVQDAVNVIGGVAGELLTPVEQ